MKNVATWYRLWYDQFVPELKKSSVVRDCLTKILQVMAQACDDHAKKMPESYVPPPPPPPMPESNWQDDEDEDDDESASSTNDFEFGHRGSDDDGPDAELETFKDLVSYGAQKRNIGISISKSIINNPGFQFLCRRDDKSMETIYSPWAS